MWTVERHENNYEQTTRVQHIFFLEKGTVDFTQK